MGNEMIDDEIATLRGAADRLKLWFNEAPHRAGQMSLDIAERLNAMASQCRKSGTNEDRLTRLLERVLNETRSGEFVITGTLASDIRAGLSQLHKPGSLE